MIASCKVMKKLVCLTIVVLCAVISGTVFGEESAKSGSEAKVKPEGHSVPCIVLLSDDVKKNKEVLDAVADAEKHLKHNIHPLIFTSDTRQSMAAQKMINLYKIKEFPVVVIDGTVVEKADRIKAVATKAAKIKTNNVIVHLKVDPEGEKGQKAMLFLCSYDKKVSLKGGQVALYAVTDKKTASGETMRNVFSAGLVDKSKYNVPAESCHFPERVSWKFPDGVNEKNSRYVAIIYEGDGRVVKALCSDEECTARDKDE